MQPTCKLNLAKYCVGFKSCILTYHCRGRWGSWWVMLENSQWSLQTAILVEFQLTGESPSACNCNTKVVCFRPKDLFTFIFSNPVSCLKYSLASVRQYRGIKIPSRLVNSWLVAVPTGNTSTYWLIKSCPFLQVSLAYISFAYSLAANHRFTFLYRAR